jgi:sodium transport system permease protein
MRWSIVRLIWLREMRDQLRDRRTLVVMILRPLLIYPLGGFALMQLTLGAAAQPVTVGVRGAEYLPTGQGGKHPYPALLVEEDSRLVVPGQYFAKAPDQSLLKVRGLTAAEGAPGNPLSAEEEAWLDQARGPLDDNKVDALLVVPPGFGKALDDEKQPMLFVLTRNDDRSRQAALRLTEVLSRWKDAVKEVRFVRKGLKPHFDVALLVRLPEFEKQAPGFGMEKIFDFLTRIFPFVLVLWSLAGALYPAVDLCAGEKERGTMETLLISPAQREEIVWGKFLTIWFFSVATALLNLLSMAATSWAFSSKLASGTLNVLAFAWCVVLLLPLSALFSAVCLAVGAYARSTKEGQYYLMPLFVLTMPLALLTMFPGVELNPFYSMIPVTGVSLLLQKLIQVGRPDPTLWLYFIPVLVPMTIYGWMALRWAIMQFQREEVLFREAERVEVRLWLRRLLREREPRPSAGQAMFCFTVVLGLSWFSLGLGTEFLATNVIRFLAFVAAPTLLMAFLLTSQPRQSLAVRVPPAWAWPVAAALVVLLTPPLTGLTLFLLRINPNLEQLIQQYRPFTEWASVLGTDGPDAGVRWWQALVVFAFLPAVCEELTFRGFILTGLQRRFRPRTAVMISSFLFCVMQMNVFHFIPTFVLGVVLAYLTTRCGSILPSILFHVLHKTLLMVMAFTHPEPDEAFLILGLGQAAWLVIVAVCTPLAAALLWWLTRKQPHPAYVAFLESDPGLEPKENPSPVPVPS